MSEIQGKPVYGICECKEKRQTLSVDQAVDLIQQMAANNWQVPTGYIPKTAVNGIVEQNTKSELELWVGTQAQWDALTEAEQKKKFGIISDDTTLQEIRDKIDANTALSESNRALLNQITNGELSVPLADGAYRGVYVSDGTFGQLIYMPSTMRLQLNLNYGFIEQKQLIHYGAVTTDDYYSPIEIDLPTGVDDLKVGDILEFDLAATYKSPDGTSSEGDTGVYYSRYTITLSKYGTGMRSNYTIVASVYNFSTPDGTGSSTNPAELRKVPINIDARKIKIRTNTDAIGNVNAYPTHLLRITKIVGSAT